METEPFFKKKNMHMVVSLLHRHIHTCTQYTVGDCLEPVWQGAQMWISKMDNSDEYISISLWLTAFSLSQTHDIWNNLYIAAIKDYPNELVVAAPKIK